MKIAVRISSIICWISFCILWLNSLFGKILTRSLYLKVSSVLGWCYLPITVILVIYAATKRNERVAVAKNYSKLLMILPILIAVTSPLYYKFGGVAEIYGMGYVTRWTSEYLSRICIILSIASFFVICGKRFVNIALSSAIFISSILLFFTMYRYGVLNTILGAILPNPTGYAEDTHLMMETNDISFTLGIFILYELFFESGKKKHLGKLILAIIFFIMAGKRIGFAALAIAAVFGFVFHKRGINKTGIIFIGTAGIVILLGYLFLNYNDTMMSYLESIGISSSGRDIIYEYFTKRTSFSPTFLGWGQAGVSKVIENMDVREVGNAVIWRGLHCDILKRYIDCGFIGFIIWSSYNLIYLPLKINKWFGNKSATVYMVVICYAFITYLTDNTDSMYTVQVLVYILPLIYYSQNVTESNSLLKRIKNTAKISGEVSAL